MIRRVAQRGQEAAFLTTLDSESIDPAGAVQFVSVRIMPKGAREVRVEYGQRGEVAAFVYFLDAGGEIDRIDDLQDDINYRKTALEDLRKVFPETGKFLDAIRRDDPNAEEEQAPRRPGVSV